LKKSERKLNTGWGVRLEEEKRWQHFVRRNPSGSGLRGRRIFQKRWTVDKFQKAIPKGRKNPPLPKKRRAAIWKKRKIHITGSMPPERRRKKTVSIFQKNTSLTAGREGLWRGGKAGISKGESAGGKKGKASACHCGEVSPGNVNSAAGGGNAAPQAKEEGVESKLD